VEIIERTINREEEHHKQGFNLRGMMAIPTGAMNVFGSSQFTDRSPNTSPKNPDTITSTTMVCTADDIHCRAAIG
jgi:hypothetical protein